LVGRQFGLHGALPDCRKVQRKYFDQPPSTP
jgi:hypothetical protein